MRHRVQGFDKYGIGEYDGASVTKLTAALGLKVRPQTPNLPAVLGPDTRVEHYWFIRS